jgi:hypothetical protein
LEKNSGKKYLQKQVLWQMESYFWHGNVGWITNSKDIPRGKLEMELEPYSGRAAVFMEHLWLHDFQGCTTSPSLSRWLSLWQKKQVEAVSIQKNFVVRDCRTLLCETTEYGRRDTTDKTRDKFRWKIRKKSWVFSEILLSAADDNSFGGLQACVAAEKYSWNQNKSCGWCLSVES